MELAGKRVDEYTRGLFGGFRCALCRAVHQTGTSVTLRFLRVRVVNKRCAPGLGPLPQPGRWGCSDRFRTLCAPAPSATDC